jgi:ABC-type Mn2+/Zn2+ transport system permease subunit
MQRALLAGVILGLLIPSIGVIASLRKMTFFGEGVAHASLAGVAIAILAGLAPLPVAIAWAIGFASFIYFLERSTKLPTDTLIGILFTASMALGIIIIQSLPGYQPELLSYLFGSLLSVQPADLLVIAPVATVILLWLGRYLPELTFAALSEESAAVTGINTKLHTYLFYVALAVTAVLGVKILGIILVPALLVLPTATSRLLTKTFRSYVTISILLSELFIILGLIGSFYFDSPSGATIVLVATAGFLISTLVRQK